MNSTRFERLLWGSFTSRPIRLQLSSGETMMSLPGGLRLSLNLREMIKEVRDNTLYLSIATRLYLLPVQPTLKVSFSTPYTLLS